MPAYPTTMLNVRLPAWLLPASWPRQHGQPQLARLTISNGQFADVQPMSPMTKLASTGSSFDAQGRMMLPPFVDAHTHLDKAFTLARVVEQGELKPGLLAAINASYKDQKANWTHGDLFSRGERSLSWAYAAGTRHIRSHVNWMSLDTVPLAWKVHGELAKRWADRVLVERVALAPLELFSRLSDALLLAQHVADSGTGAVLGGFLHSHNWSESAVDNLLAAAAAFDLDIDLHVDEELNPAACGLLYTARRAAQIGFKGRIVCGHVCALAVQNEQQVNETLEAVRAAPITVVSLPVTNLLLQDATADRTPRLRGLTLVKELRARGIPLLFASDNVQDPFCPLGNYDLQHTMQSAVMTGQLTQAFDDWSQCICRADWLSRTCTEKPMLIGLPANGVLLTSQEPFSWPSRTGIHQVLRQGALLPAKTEPQTIASNRQEVNAC